MIKKGYIIALTVVSVLLGSLFYNNMTQAQKLHTYQDSVKINILSVDSSGWTDQGVIVAGNIKNSFPFNPKGSLQNVTGLWIDFLYWSKETGTWNIELYLNDVKLTSTSYQHTGKPKLIFLEITDTTLRNKLKIGVNVISLRFTSVVYLQELNITVEYEYLAR